MEAGGDFRLGEPAAVAEALETVSKVVAAADSGHQTGMEGLAGSGAASSGVEDGGDLGFVMVVEQGIDLSDDGGWGAAEFPGGEFGRECELSGGAAAQPGPEGDVAVADEGDVLDEQSGHTFALAVRGFGIVPESREVGGQMPLSISYPGASSCRCPSIKGEPR